MDNPELQQQAVAKLLQEVPLIDGYEKILASLLWSVFGYLKLIRKIMVKKVLWNIVVFVEIYINPEYV